MKCLHGEPCAQSTTEKGSFWFCNQNSSCKLICSEDENYLYEKAIGAWKSTKQPQPRCEKHNKLAKNAHRQKPAESQLRSTLLRVFGATESLFLLGLG